jgi:ABC-type branched-subunit amino acid transport system permease subunit
MRTSGLPNFKKPWGRIERDLPVGNYTVQIANNYNSVNWHGNRGIVLTTRSSVGGKNFLLPTSFLLISLMCLVAGIFFCWRFRALRELGKLNT